MKTYLVGGAVRDELLGLPVRERDWVVVGATAAQMLDLGYRQVGRDFPVFLHPETHEEHALARTERKTAPGYRGFVVHAEPDVTLEEDLLRRDLTINAMARDEAGGLIDPFNGRADLEARLLRHVSPAFAEDPVRILRVARFAARFAHLGFRVADETRALMRRMVAAGEVDALVPERVWQEMERALGEGSPATFFEVLRDCGALAVLFPASGLRLWHVVWLPAASITGVWMGLREEGLGPGSGGRAWMHVPLLVAAFALPVLPGLVGALTRVEARARAEEQHMLRTLEDPGKPGSWRALIEESAKMPAADRVRMLTFFTPNLVFGWMVLLVAAGRAIAARLAAWRGWPPLSRGSFSGWRLPGRLIRVSLSSTTISSPLLITPIRSAISSASSM